MSLIYFLGIPLCGKMEGKALKRLKIPLLCIVKKEGLKILFSSPFCLSMSNSMEEPQDE